MSSITKLQQELIAHYVVISSEALFLFDCMITLSQEVDVIWRRKWNVTTWLYTFNRYGTLVDQIVLLMPIWSFKSCEGVMHSNQVLQLVQFLCFAWFSTIRVYALLDGKYRRLIAAVVFLLNLVPFATNLFNFITSDVFVEGNECTGLPTGSRELYLSFSLSTRAAVIIGDVLVLAVTWTKTAQAYLESRRLNIKAPLATMLFRDGTLYFMILLVINALQMINTNIPTLLTMEIIVPFFEIFPPMIVSHFILNLRQIEPAGSSWVSANQSHSLRFVGNMGQSLQFGVGDANGEEDDVYEIQATSVSADRSPLAESGMGTTEDMEVDQEQLGHNCATEAQQEPTYSDA